MKFRKKVLFGISETMGEPPEGIGLRVVWLLSYCE